MVQQVINVGAAPNDRSGDTWRDAFVKSNDNFTELYLRASKLIITEEDFPNQDANTITLNDGDVFIFTQSMTLTKRFVVNEASVTLIGLGFNSVTISYSGSGTFITGTDASVELRNFSINPGASNDAFDIRSTVAQTNNFYAINVFVGSCDRYGYFENLSVVQMENTGSTSTTTGCFFSGGFDVLVVDNANFTGPSTMVSIDLDGATFASRLNISSCVFSGPVGSVGISGLVSSGNIGAGVLADVQSCTFSVGTHLVNIDPSDVRWNFRSNSSVEDSRNVADGYLDGGAETLTVSAAGDWYEIGVPGAGGVSWVGDLLERFTISTGGVLTYIGEQDIQVKISGRATVEKVGGGSDEIEVRIAKNWTGATTDGGEYKSRAITQNAAPTSVPLGALLNLIENDTVRLIFANNGSTADIVISVATMEIFE